MSEFNKLIGKNVKNIFADKSKTHLVFETDNGNFGYESYGDCCSYSWFEHFDGINALIGQTVVEIEDKDLPAVTDEEHKEKGYDSLQQYGWTFKTNKGRATLEMRNDSNGYYGGSVEKSSDTSTTGMNRIAEDF